MKTIYLLRHAKAVTADDATPDIKRTLLKEGKNEAKDMAKEFSAKVMLPELLISSTAKRAVETARIFAKEVGYKKKKIIRNEKLYANDSAVILDLIKTLSDSADSVMIVGHNPSISQFAALLSQSFQDELPSCGLLGIKFNARKWREIKEGEGEMIYNSYPDLQKKRDKQYKEYRKELEDQLSETLSSSLKKIHSATAEKLEKKIRKSSRALAKKFVKQLQSDEVGIELENGKKQAAKKKTSSGTPKTQSGTAGKKSARPKRTGASKTESKTTKGNK